MIVLELIFLLGLINNPQRGGVYSILDQACCEAWQTPDVLGFVLKAVAAFWAGNCTTSVWMSQCATAFWALAIHYGQHKVSML